MIDSAHIDAFFTYHPPSAEDIPKFTAIRDKAKELAHIIVDNTPASADQTAAIRLLREVVMTANAAIICTPHLSQRAR
jgi:hypothetical protein